MNKIEKWQKNIIYLLFNQQYSPDNRDEKQWWEDIELHIIGQIPNPTDALQNKKKASRK